MRILLAHFFWSASAQSTTKVRPITLLSTEKSVKSLKMENPTKMLSDIAGFIAIQTKKKDIGPIDNTIFISGDFVHNKRILVSWIEQTSEKIINEVIPDNFWGEYHLTKPNNVSALFLRNPDTSSNVVLVILWSLCSPICRDAIKTCLIHGSKKWQTEKRFGPMDWLVHYVQCTCICVMRSCTEIKNKASAEQANEIVASDTILLQAYSLCQAVSNTSKWYRLLTTKDSLKMLQNLFCKHLHKGELRSTFKGGVSQLCFFSDNRDVVELVSVGCWFNDTIIFPALKKIMAFGPMASLSKSIKKLQNRDDDNDSGSNSDLDIYKKRTDTFALMCNKAARDMNLDLNDKTIPVAATLGVLAHSIQEIIDKVPEDRILKNETLVLMKLCPIIVDAIVKKKPTVKVVTYVLKRQPSLIDTSITKLVINQICQLQIEDPMQSKMKTKKLQIKDNGAGNKSSKEVAPVRVGFGKAGSNGGPPPTAINRIPLKPSNSMVQSNSNPRKLDYSQSQTTGAQPRLKDHCAVNKGAKRAAPPADGFVPHAISEFPFPDCQ